MSVKNHFKAGDAEVSKFTIVKDKIALVELDDVDGVVKHYRVGCFDISEKIQYLNKLHRYKQRWKMFQMTLVLSTA